MISPPFHKRGRYRKNTVNLSTHPDPSFLALRLLVLDRHLNPDCRDGKHAACRADAWCTVIDASAECSCPCHSLATVASA
jgi:hypothetical protein